MGDSAVLAVALMMSSVSSSEDVFRERGKKPAFPSWVRFCFLFVSDSPVFVNDKRPAFKCSGCFQSHLNRFLKTSVGELVLPFLPFETADFLKNL